MYLTVLDGSLAGTTHSFDPAAGSVIVVGRDDDCDITLDSDERVSRRHARLTAHANGTVEVIDLDSTNGVHVGDTRVVGSRTVRSGETIRIGRTRVAVRATDPTATGLVGPATVIGGANDLPAPHRNAADAKTSTSESNRRPSRRVLTAIGAIVALAAVATTAVALNSGDDEPEAVLDATAITEQSERGVLQIQSEIDGQLIGTGSGWVYDLDRGLIVTNYHVVGVGTEFSVGVGPDRRTASLVGAAPCDDLAVLRVDRTDDLVELPLGDQSELRNGHEVVALGYPGTASQTPSLITSTGTVSTARSSFDAPALDLPRYPNVVITQTPINPGNSGGPLLDMNGSVVGVNTAGSLVNQNQNYAIGADRLAEILPELAKGNSLGWNGFVLQFPQSPGDVTALGYDESLFGSTVFALDAVAQSPAANTGIFRQLDGEPVPIVNIDGVAMDGTLQTLCSAIGGNTRGQTSNFTVTDGVELFEVPFDFS